MPYGALPKDSGLIPISSEYVPNTGFVALQGGTVTTDASSNSSAPVVAQLGDGVGLISSALIAAIRYLKVAMVQDIEVSNGNSSTANLATTATFTGTSATTTGVSAIQVCLFATQNCTIQIQQAQEDPGVNWNIIDTWTYAANSTAQDATRTIQAMGASARVLVTNNGGITTTALRLTTVMCPTAEVLPRNLTQLGNTKMAIQEPLGSVVSANAASVVIASDQAPMVSATATRSNVTAAITDASMLASNASRKGALFYNESTAILYLAYGSGAASLTSYTVQVPPNGFFELPLAPIYTGAIRGISSAANGTIRITELS